MTIHLTAVVVYIGKGNILLWALNVELIWTGHGARYIAHVIYREFTCTSPVVDVM